MKTVNKVILIGNVTKEPFVKVTAGDKKVATFSVATNRNFKTPTGEIMSESEYTSCVTWGPLAEQAEKFITKGKLVYIEGHLKTRTIDKEDGTKTWRTEVVVGQLIFLSKREDYDTPTTGTEDSSSPVSTSPAVSTPSSTPVDSDDFADLDTKF
jgi:single-strand DNA-binding protein